MQSHVSPGARLTMSPFLYIAKLNDLLLNVTQILVQNQELFTGDTSKDNHSTGPVIRGASP